MFEITGQEIKQLNDVDLRTLVALLCEVELRSKGYSASGVTWGGDQNAGDGGIDVRVETDIDFKGTGFIPSSKTGFQVKKPDMPRGEILSEMKPEGELRDSIKELIKGSGAYIIVSSKSSTADPALKRRQNGLREAVKDDDPNNQLITDFFDSNRLASWVRCYPSLILWVKSKLGTALYGWRPYQNWSNVGAGEDEEYIHDDNLQIEFALGSDNKSYSVVEGIQKVRDFFVHAPVSLRITGLSGLGKTRFVQALFDKRIGEKNLDKNKVFYTDVGFSPSPDPVEVAKQLIESRSDGFLIVDNCKPDLHRTLTSICKSSDSKLNLITVEYDVQDDIQEETEVIRLKPSSIEVIEKLVLNRYPEVGQANARKISEFSGGNFRIAVTLASTIKRGDSVISLKDKDLFNRLIQQGNDPDDTLLNVIEVAALVYSFNHEYSDENLELDILSKIANLEKYVFFGVVNQLEKRELIQKRGKWRAVLPHAISNELAERAILKYPLDYLLNIFFEGDSERILISFCRRLGYLHENEFSKSLLDKWLEKDGILYDFTKLDETKIEIVKNLSPINPERILSKLETITDESFFTNKNKFHHSFKSLLSSIVYDQNHFRRAFLLLKKFALSEEKTENVNSFKNKVASLFQVRLSGTEATIEDRLTILRELVNSAEEHERNLGLTFLRSFIKTGYFTSHFDYTFGSRLRGFGFEPYLPDDIKKWYLGGLSIILEAYEKEKDDTILEVFIEKLDNLINITSIQDEVIELIERLTDSSFREQIWVRLNRVLKRSEDKLDGELRKRIIDLSKKFKPKDLIEKARTYLLTNHDVYDIEDIEDGKDFEDRYQNMIRKIHGIGAELAKDEEAFNIIIPETLVGDNNSRVFHGGFGLAEDEENLVQIWSKLISEVHKLRPEKVNLSLINGFLSKTYSLKPDLTNKFLDEALKDEILKQDFPFFHSNIPLDEKGVERLISSIESDSSESWKYTQLAYGGIHKSVDDENFVKLLKALIKKKDGANPVFELINMRVYSIERNEKIEMSKTLADCINEILSTFDFINGNLAESISHYQFDRVIHHSFDFDSGEDAARRICNNIYNSSHSSYVSFYELNSLLKGIIKSRPLIILDELLDHYSNDQRYLLRSFTNDIEESASILSEIDDKTILDWCSKKPLTRYELIASVIIPFKSDPQNNLQWTELAKEILSLCPSKEVVLNEYSVSLRPSSWTGSRSSILELRVSLIEELVQYSNSDISEWAINELAKFNTEIQANQKWETERSRIDEYGFE
tara:strand:- start:17980 stop:21780 length:3801 start_codon:yes stop_codon:yes gene_type:complete